MIKRYAVALILVASYCLSSPAEARMGGGGSFGSRGSRGFSARPYQSPYRSAPGGSGFGQSAPRQAPAPVVPPQQYNTNPGFGGGGFFRGMAGGLAGGFLGSMLFRQMGNAGGAGYPAGGGGGIGILEILLLGLLGFMLFRMFVKRQADTVVLPGSMGAAYGGTQYQNAPVEQASQDPEPEAIQTIQRYDAGFDPRRFKDERMDNFFTIQAAWSKRDLNPVRDLFAPEMAQELERQLATLKARGRINRLENIAVREINLCEAWQEQGKEYLTVRFYANLLDYTVDENSNQVVEGDNAHPVKFEEYWTYARDIGQNQWRLSAVENT